MGGKLKGKEKKRNGRRSSEIETVMSDSDKESLDIAMRLMNDEVSVTCAK